MIVEIIPVGQMLNRSYLILCEETRKAAMVDAAWEEDTLLKAADKHKAQIEFLLCTHGHADHVNLVPEFLRKFPEARAVCHKDEKIPLPEERVLAVSDGDRVKLGNIEILCVHTPGHTPGSVTYIAGDHAFFGDTLFAGEDCGRVDFYKRGPQDMAASLQKIRRMPDHLTVCSGHKYGPYETTKLKFEKDYNRALKCRTLEDFLALKGS